MVFKFIVVLCATLAFANAGLIQQSNVGLLQHSNVGLLQQPSLRLLNQPNIGLLQQSNVGLLQHSNVGLLQQPSLRLLNQPNIDLLQQSNVGLLQQPIAAAYSSAPAVSSVYSSVRSPSVLSTRTVVAAAPTALKTIATYPSVPAYQTVQAAVPLTRLAYSPASEVSHVYSSIGAPSALPLAATQYAYAQAAPQIAISSPAIGSTQQSTVRSLGGTISSYSKAVDTAYSSVRKADTRISNNVYTPALATKTIAYAAQPTALIQQKAIPVVSHVSFDGIGAHYAW